VTIDTMTSPTGRNATAPNIQSLPVPGADRTVQDAAHTNMRTMNPANPSDISEDGSFHVNALGAGIRNGDVSAEWMRRSDEERFLSLDDMGKQLQRRWQDCKTQVLQNRSIQVLPPPEINKDTIHQLTIEINGGQEVVASHHGFNQLAALVKAPSSYLRTLPSPVVAQNLNWGLKHNRTVEEVGVFFDKTRLRAVTGPTYGRIPDFEVVEALQKIAGRGDGSDGYRWKVPGQLDWATMKYHPNMDRDMFVLLVDDRNPIEVGTYRDPRTGQQHPDLMFRGLIAKNSETGAGSLTISAFYLRGVCMNRNLWGVEGFEEISIRHTKYAGTRWAMEAEPALNSYANGDAKRLMDGVKKAKDAIVAKDDEAALDFLRGLDGFSKVRAEKVIQHIEVEEGTKARTAWDFAQGITALARSTSHQDERFKIELQAKRILDRVAA
jgi:Domain of unknown function (DUF932)